MTSQERIIKALRPKPASEIEIGLTDREAEAEAELSLMELRVARATEEIENVIAMLEDFRGTASASNPTTASIARMTDRLATALRYLERKEQ